MIASGGCKVSREQSPAGAGPCSFVLSTENVPALGLFPLLVRAVSTLPAGLARGRGVGRPEGRAPLRWSVVLVGGGRSSALARGGWALLIGLSRRGVIALLVRVIGGTRCLGVAALSRTGRIALPAAVRGIARLARGSRFVVIGRAVLSTLLVIVARTLLAAAITAVTTAGLTFGADGHAKRCCCPLVDAAGHLDAFAALE